MGEFGGLLPKERLPAKVRTVAADVEADVCGYFKIIPDAETGVATGTVCVWESEWQGEPLNEIGWMSSPRFKVAEPEVKRCVTSSTGLAG